MVRTALITGGSGGIGKACGRRLAELGYDVVLTARRESPLRAAAAEIGARFVVADASDPDSFHQAVAAAGTIHLLVHAAGVLGGTYVRKQTFAQWRETITANLDSCFVVASAALSQMESGSRFVFISSSAAHEPMPARTAYSASKAGMNAFARALALEVDRDGINVHIVTPGPVETEMLQTSRSRCTRSAPRTSRRPSHGWTRSTPRWTCPRSRSMPSRVGRRHVSPSFRTRSSAGGPRNLGDRSAFVRDSAISTAIDS